VEEGKAGSLEKMQVVIIGAMKELNKLDATYNSGVEKVYEEARQSDDEIL
jgi:hypothetical protein